MDAAAFGPPQDAKPLLVFHLVLCLSAFSRGFLKKVCIVVVDVKEFKVSSKVTLKLGLILSLTGTQGGCRCAVLQP